MDPLDADLTSFLTHDRFVRSLARSLVRDSSTLDDVVQETWWAAIRKQPGSDRSLRPWLAKVARNFALKMRRGETRREQRETIAAAREAQPSTAALVEREAARKSVVEAVMELAEPFRETVVLRYFEGLPPRAIARRMGVPVETVKSRLKRALALLRTKLSPSDPNKSASFGAGIVALASVPRGAALATAAATTKTFLLGALAMSTGAKWATAAAAVIVLLFAAYRFLPSATAPDSPALREEAAAEVDATASHVRSANGPAAITPRHAADESAPASQASTLPTTGSVLVRVRYSDGASAADIGIEVLFLGSSWVDAAIREKRTDAAGTVVFEGVPIGQAEVRADRGGNGMTDVKAGERAEVTVDLKGTDVDGVVVDDRGAAVAGAEILLDKGLDHPGGRPVATSAKDGTFRVRGIQWAMGIGARAEGYEPSLFSMITTSSNIRRLHENVKLVLIRGGASLAGRILGPDDLPVGSALVLLGGEGHSRFTVTLEDGAYGFTQTSFLVKSDAQGRFRFPSLPARLLPAAVRAAGFALWRGSVSPAPGAGSEMLIRLDRGVSLSGTVTDDAGHPFERAIVRFGDWGKFETSERWTDKSGRYEFDHLPAGDLHVLAEHAEMVILGELRASTTISAASGQALRWDPVLSAGLVIEGRVVDESGKPRPAPVHLTRDDRERSWVSMAGLWTGGDGRFRFTNLEDVPHRVVVEWTGMEGPMGEVAAMSGVRPGGAEIVIVAPVRANSRVSAFGRVVDPAGKPVAGVEVSAMNADSGHGAIKTTDAAGAFSFLDLMPGRFRVHARARGYPFVATPEKLLASGASWDVGTLELQAGGRLEAHVRRADGSPVGKTYLPISSLDREISLGLPVEADVATLSQITPGRYELRRRLEDPTPIRFDIVAGETTTIDVVLDPAVVRVLRIRDEGPQVSGLVHVVAKKHSSLSDEYITRRGSEPFEISLSLDPGSYDLEVTADSGRSTKTTLVVPAGATAKEIVNVVLK